MSINWKVLNWYLLLLLLWRLTLDRIHDLLVEEFDDDIELYAIEPPIENANGDIDCDFDYSVDEVTWDKEPKNETEKKYNLSKF